MKEKNWSLSRRLTLWFTAGALVLLAANSFAAEWLLRKAVHDEITELAKSELEAVDNKVQELVSAPSDAEHSARKVDKATFENIFRDRDQSNTDERFAWRVWEPDQTLLIENFSSSKSFNGMRDAKPEISEVGRTMRGEGTSWWRVQTLKSGYRVAIVIEGAMHMKTLALSKWFLLTSSIVGAAMATVVSWFLLGRVSRTLRLVAESVRSEVDPNGVQLIAATAPQEIRDVAAALWERLSRVRAESEQAQIFTAGLAHELRSPIQNLIGETEVALIQPRDASKYRAVLESHLHELRELGDAVDNLMTICAKRQTDSKALREEFDLAHEAELRLAREQSRARLSDVTLEISSSGDTRLIGDREALLRALRNLAGNAIEWSPPGSRVKVDLSGQNGDITVTVDDQGPGVPPDLREKIFEPFFTGPQKKGGRVGYGLGLAIARSATADQGGTIEVGTSSMGGARFTLVLPKRRSIEP